MEPKEQLTVITAALLHGMTYASLGQKAVADIVTQAQAVVNEINARQEKHLG